MTGEALLLCQAAGRQLARQTPAATHLTRSMKSKALWQSSDRLVLYCCNRVDWFGHFALLAGRAASSGLIAVNMATALHLHRG